MKDWLHHLERSSNYFLSQTAAYSGAGVLSVSQPLYPILWTDVSKMAVGTQLQQMASSAAQPLSAFSRELQPTVHVYFEIKHFRYILEIRNFIVYTDHKPLTCSGFQQWSLFP